MEYKYDEWYVTKEDVQSNPDADNYVWMICQNPDGCSIHVAKDEVAVQECQDLSGCYLPGGEVKITLSDLPNQDGIYTKEFEKEELDDPSLSRTDRLAFGSINQNVPLRFSDFGYWDTVEKMENMDGYVSSAFIMGVPAKEVDMKTLAEIQEITSDVTYHGRAYVGIGSGFKNYADEPRPDEDDGQDRSNGFVAAGSAQLKFSANDGMPQEKLLMSFNESGWYNVYMNGDGTDLRFFGNPAKDNRFTIFSEEAPTSATDIQIRYYGDEHLGIASEAVGTATVQAVQMQDGLRRNIEFSFGAVKD